MTTYDTGNNGSVPSVEPFTQIQKEFIFDSFRLFIRSHGEAYVRELTLRFLQSDKFSDEDIVRVNSIIEEFHNEIGG